jgi:hypothetical protein
MAIPIPPGVRQLPADPNYVHLAGTIPAKTVLNGDRTPALPTPKITAAPDSPSLNVTPGRQSR